MKDLHVLAGDQADPTTIYWPGGEDQQLLHLHLERQAADDRQTLLSQQMADDAALDGLRESDPETYRMVVYSWA